MLWYQRKKCILITEQVGEKDCCGKLKGALRLLSRKCESQKETVKNGVGLCSFAQHIY